MWILDCLREQNESFASFGKMKLVNIIYPFPPFIHLLYLLEPNSFSCMKDITLKCQNRLMIPHSIITQKTVISMILKLLKACN